MPGHIVPVHVAVALRVVRTVAIGYLAATCSVGPPGREWFASNPLVVVGGTEAASPGRESAPGEAARRFHALILPRGVVILQSPWQDAGMPYKQDPNVVPTTVRLPRQLLERIDEIAASERRSRNQMVILLLERATKPQ